MQPEVVISKIGGCKGVVPPQTAVKMQIGAKAKET
jgi:hypothetical protein